MRIEKVIAQLVLASLSLLFTFGLVEATARIYLNYIAPEATFLSFASHSQLVARYGVESEDGAVLQQLYTPHRYLGFVPTPNYERGANRHNALGFRGEEIERPKPQGEFRIVCLGGSTTYTSDVDDHTLSYPARLEASLHELGHDHVRVINGAAASWTSWESLISFQLRVLDLDPDMIVIYHAINDVHARIVWPPESYVGDNSGWRAPNSTGVSPPSVLELSTAIRMVMIRQGWTRAPADLANTIDRPAATYYGDMMREQMRRGQYPEGIFVDTPGAQMLDANEPQYFKRNLENLIAVANARGIRVMIASFAYSPDFPEEPRVASVEYQTALAAHNRVIAEIGSRADVSFYDFAKDFPKDSRYFTDGRHVNEEGAARKGELFAGFIHAQGLTGRR